MPCGLVTRGREPPAGSVRSSTRTRCPRPARWNAAEAPCTPAPTIATSNVSIPAERTGARGRGRSRGERRAGPEGPPAGVVPTERSRLRRDRQLVERGDVDKPTALEFAPDPEKLKMAFKGIKVSAPGIL